jgi:hypothetical protein
MVAEALTGTRDGYEMVWMHSIQTDLSISNKFKSTTLLLSFRCVIKITILNRGKKLCFEKPIPPNVSLNFQVFPALIRFTG